MPLKWKFYLARPASSPQGDLLGWTRLRIVFEFQHVPVGLEEPHVAILKVTDQLGVSLRVHLPRPHHRRSVDICVVINPVFVRNVVRSVTDDHQVPSSLESQVRDQVFPTIIRSETGAPGRYSQ